MTGTYRRASPKMLLEGVKSGAEEKVAFRAADGNELLKLVNAELCTYMWRSRSRGNPIHHAT